MIAMASQITGVSIVCAIVGSGADQRKHQSSASLAFVRGIHRWPVNSPHKRLLTRKMFLFDDVIMDVQLSLWRLKSSASHLFVDRPVQANVKENTKALHYWSFVRGLGGRFKNTYELLNLRALKFSYVNKIHIFQCMGMIFCVEFQRYPLKFHTKYLTHTLKDMIFMQFWNFKTS